jgi:hypothetical protein
MVEFLPLAQVGPGPQLRVALKGYSIPDGNIPLRGHIKNFEAIALQVHPPEPIQVPLIVRLTVSLNGMRATVDSKAAPVPAVLAAEDPAAVELPAEEPAEENLLDMMGLVDSMGEVEYVAKDYGISQ